MRRCAVVLLVVAGLMCTQVVAAQDTAENAKQKAIASAQAWLELIDLQEYNASYDSAASLFKQAITKEEWATAAMRAREPMGKVLSRTLQAASYETSLPGAPDGEYVVIQYSTTFENKESAVETITPMRDEDNTWRVSGYYIR